MEHTQIYSEIIAGTMTWGSWGKKLSKKEMGALMHHCVDHDITTFDHADIYGDYENETLFGNAFADSGIDRTKIQLITKCGLQMTRGRSNQVKHYQYDKEYIIWSAEESLRKLQTDFVDLFLLHRPSPLMQPNEIAEAVEILKRDGKIKEFGVSNFTPSQIALLETDVPVSGNQVEFSLTHGEPMYDGTFDDCMAHGRMAMAWSPLGGYFNEKNERTSDIAKAMAQLSEKYDADESQLLLAFVMKHPARVYPVVGTTNERRLTAAMEATKMDLELEDWFILLEASNGRRVP
ncbi:aldo/keto reductase [Allomuricauda sp. d1]|uniref:aldo/keto reductase n=1 Tax=Allomuricauda sp. d1 TaxID=3136725 RepID=UPI0031E07489